MSEFRTHAHFLEWQASCPYIVLWEKLFSSGYWRIGNISIILKLKNTAIM
jgi:hypothetical protein